MKVGQLICFVLGIFLLSLGGGLMGGRLAAQKHLAALAERAPAAAEPAKAPAREEEPLSVSPAEPGPEAAGDEAAVLLPARPEGVPAVAAPEKERTDGGGASAPMAGERGDASQLRYVIQAISASNRNDARISREKIMAAGFPAGIFEADLPGTGKVYRVYVGPYDNEAAARLALEAIRNIPGFHGSFLKALE